MNLIYFYIILYFFIYTLFYSLYNVLGKKYFDLFYYSPYYMLFIIGSINSTVLLLYDMIAYFVNEEYSGIILGFKDNINTFINFCFFFLELFVKFIYTLGIWVTLYYFTPYHFIISDFISQIISYYINIITNSKINKYNSTINNIIIFSVVYLINFICSLIFNEIIIIKCCKLYYYTKKYIKRREKMDTFFLINDNNAQESFMSIELTSEI